MADANNFIKGQADKADKVLLEEPIGEETPKEDDLLGGSGGSYSMQPRRNSLNQQHVKHVHTFNTKSMKHTYILMDYMHLGSKFLT